MRRLAVHLETDLPRTLAVGRGTCVFVNGSWGARGNDVTRPRLILDGNPYPAVQTGIPPGSVDRDGGFCGVLPVPPIENPRLVAVELEASLDGGPPVREPLGGVDLAPALAPPGSSGPTPAGDDPLVAI